MGASRLEINVERLLNKCEVMANDDPNRDWRLEMYIKSLEKMIKELHCMPNICKPEKEKMTDYIRRCTFLKGLIKTEQLENATEKAMAVQLLSHGVATTETNPITKEIHQKTSSKYGKELRADLFGTKKKSSLTESTLRLRQNSLITNSNISGTNSGEDLDVLIKYHHSMQEKIAENMLSMAKNLKEQSEMASNIIKKDTEVVLKSAKMTDDNLSSLKSESAVLADHNKRAWKCSMLFMIILVIAIFISMVMFMKLFKKRTVVQ